MKHRKLICVFIVLALLFLCIYLIPVEREMNERFLCQVLDQQDETFSDQVTVTFTGTYTDYLLRSDVFKGRIEIEGYEFLSPKAEDVELTVSIDWLDHFSESNPGYPDKSYKSLGTFCGDEDFERFILWLNVPDAESANWYHARYYLTYPSMTLDEIHEILQ